MSDEKQIALFTKWADETYGKTMPPKFLPQTERYQSYWECWRAALSSQPKPAPVLLTDEEIDTIYIKSGFMLTLDKDEFEEIADLIESAVLRKNGWGV